MTDLRPIITHSEQSHTFGEFWQHPRALGPLSLSRRSIPARFLVGPYVAIQYRLEILQVPEEEIWSCVMSPTADGFAIVSQLTLYVHFFFCMVDVFSIRIVKGDTVLKLSEVN